MSNLEIISVKDGLPEFYGTEVIAFCIQGDEVHAYHAVYWGKDEWEQASGCMDCDGSFVREVTHWAEMPKEWKL